MKRLTSIWMVFLLTGLLAGCGGKEEKNSVNIGYFPNVTHTQALVMKEQGRLESALGEEIDVNWISFNAGPAEVEALFAEDIDIGYIGPVPAINAYVKSNGDIKILSGATQAGAIMVKRKGADIQSLEDLAGKKVAIPQLGNTQHLCLLNLLSECGLAPLSDGGNVDVVVASNADVGNMMNRGDIDAALVPEPWGATLMENGAELLLDENQIYMDGQYSVAVVVVRKEFMEEYPDIVEKFLKEHEEVTVWINQNTDESLDKINAEIYEATQKELENAILEQAFARIKVDSTLNEESIYGFAEIGLEQNFITKMPEKDIIEEVK